MLNDVTGQFHGAQHGDCCDVFAQFDIRIFGKELSAVELRKFPQDFIYLNVYDWLLSVFQCPVH
jgi:hypothetical protein